ncbi:MAG: AmmeMemoRadiSam system protein B [Phycisphaerales bacterium]|jgi:MEMO1 family protein|nr:AmmeMemoRadiSam system protein B [Phycisphaerales bacterium]MBT7170517.1 AmmeMemoRadiSam system protein B [Phycisphaerales bacterium]
MESEIRLPARAGQFYPDGPACAAEAEALLAGAPRHEFDRPVRGAVVPHAGWAYSGALAAEGIVALCEGGVETVVILAADHTGAPSPGALWASGVWRTPIGDVEVDSALAEKILLSAEGLLEDRRPHLIEHSIEVQIPLLQLAAPGVKIVPIIVPPVPEALALGQAIGQCVDGMDGVKLLCSTDLTHAGGHFGPAHGQGDAVEAYVRANDHAILELILAGDEAGAFDHAAVHQSACGGGAIGAFLSANRGIGALLATLLSYTNSYEITHARTPLTVDDTTVGYATVVTL